MKHMQPFIGGFNIPKARSILTVSDYDRSMMNVKPPSSVIVAGKSKFKKKKLFSDFSKITALNNVCLNKLDDNYSINELKKLLTKERTMYRKIINKGATKVRKLYKQKGFTDKSALEEKNKFLEGAKLDMKKLMFRIQLMAMKEFNARI